MTDVKRLLDEASPLPWGGGVRAESDEQPEFFIPALSRKGYWSNAVHSDRPDADAALIVHAVNRLHVYEVAVEALEGLLEDTQHAHHSCGDGECPVALARAVLRRLRGDS